MKEQSLAGQRCLVTGAGRGIGRELAVSFARAGAAVAVLDRDGASARAAAEAIAREGGRAHPLTLDLANTAAIRPALESLAASFGPIDILVNNAAIVMPRLFLDTPPDELETVLRVNLHAPFTCAQVLARSMVERRHGRIINMASHSGLLGSTARAAYAASKGGLIAATRVMAVELAPHGITVNAIAPGPIESEQTLANHSAQRRAAWNDVVPVGRYGRAEEVVAAALFLASPGASYITGHTLAVDGGFAAAGLMLRQP
ncbi:MAG TPA: glucose 1-dehydrogenase [Usitatibacter sp.]|nr:glucose 1-dehydrogenase [Usitatibacter sp.]